MYKNVFKVALLLSCSANAAQNLCGLTVNEFKSKFKIVRSLDCLNTFGQPNGTTVVLGETTEGRMWFLFAGGALAGVTSVSRGPLCQYADTPVCE